MVKTISLLASRMPLWLEVFLHFSFSNIDVIHVVSFVQETQEKRLSSHQNVLVYYCTEMNIVIYALYTKQRICGQ